MSGSWVRLFPDIFILGLRARSCVTGESKNAPGPNWFQRNFKLDSPISASTKEMIQNRITTWLSVQPRCSK